MIIFNFVLLILVSFSAKAQAETCEVGVDGCLWTCRRAALKAGQMTCLGMPGRPKSCEIGSSKSLCGTTCTCSSPSKMCKVGVNGCSWTCEKAPLKPGQVTCLAVPSTPEYCSIGSRSTSCGTTCKCSQETKCTVGVKGCSWNCVTSPPPAGTMQCLGYPATPTECYPGETSSMCGTTCTCSILDVDITL